jgi:hypothetical protein
MDLSKICDAVDKVYKSNRVQDSRPTTDFIFPADSTSVNDNKGHFPIPDAEHGRNAIARVNQYSSLPKWYSGKMNLKQLVEHVVNEVHKKFPSIEVSKDAKIPKPNQVKDSGEFQVGEEVYLKDSDPDEVAIITKIKGDVATLEFFTGDVEKHKLSELQRYTVEDSTDEEYSKYVEYFSGEHSSEEIKEKIKEYRSKFGNRTIVTPERKELVAFAEYQDGTPVYSYKQKAWEKIEDCGVTTSSDVDAGIPGKVNPVEDSRQDEKISHSWEEFEQKVLDYGELSDHVVDIAGSPRGYRISASVLPIEDKVGDSQEYRIEDDREYSKQQLIDRPPLWIKDKDIWEKAVDKATRGGSKDTTVVVPIVIYKRMGGTKAMNKKEKEERAAADERRMQAETSREGVEDSMYEKIKVGDTLRIVRGDHVGKFAEVLEVKEDGSYRLKDLQTDEEFDEPANLFGVRVTVTDSGYPDAEDGVSLRSALATILKETDPKVRQRSIQSKVLSFLNAYGMDAEIESDGKIWLNDDDTSVRVDESTVSIKKGGESETEDYALLEDIEKWYGRIKELSGK